ncbi:stage II sporulation protein M [Luteimonas deserti]|uniref:Stage II sporulation protein M n=1 Tax=Luteimonas deserti TaxID=2752306 RepID=A0A7Z0QRI0_9GAMM|nr:stage II sporulation protein M [Luteimonas deserti]NYZ63504.1 stage II sporulation protein M [Luteimonas deserti]
MKQATFVARHAAEWDAFERWLDARQTSPRRARATRREWQGIADEDVPSHYRRLCQQLALARRRGYSPQVTHRLQALMQRGHNLLYRPPPPPWRRALEFMMAGFPRLVRAQRGCLWASLALFALPMLMLYGLVLHSPELAYGVLSPQQLGEMETMYDPDVARHSGNREAQSDMQMFGFYVWNNVSLGFRTFASGLLAGVGTIAVLIFNGTFFGVIAGHLQAIGHGGPFWRFVVGHSAPELTAIVIAGAGGLRLGLALLAPGRLRRVDALVQAGRDGGLLCLGIFAMLVFAAFVEAFWSSNAAVPDPVRFSVGGALWVLVLLWLWRGGRGLAGAR